MLELRRARRYNCSEAVDCEIQGKVLVALMQDVSLGGARLRGANLPQVGSLLRLTPTFGLPAVPYRNWVYCQVCWLRQGEVQEAGIRFMEPSSRIRKSWIGELLPEWDPQERRQSIRVQTEVYVEVQGLGRRPVEAVSTDLSGGGALIRLDRSIRQGDRVDLNLCLPWTCLDLPAQVVRQISPEHPYHSLRFLSVSPHDQAALDGFIRSELPEGQADPTQGLPFLKLLNR